MPTRDAAASLGSILAILEHVLAADRIWMARLRGEPVDTAGLLEPTFRELAPLRREREAMHDEIEGFFAGACEAFLNGTLRSVDSRGDEHVDPVRIAVAQMFDHQTHDRGQVHALLREHRPEPLALDLHRLLREGGRGRTWRGRSGIDPRARVRRAGRVAERRRRRPRRCGGGGARAAEARDEAVGRSRVRCVV